VRGTHSVSRQAWFVAKACWEISHSSSKQTKFLKLAGFIEGCRFHSLTCQKMSMKYISAP